MIASGFLANAAFYSVDGFLPVYLTRVAGLTLTVAALVVTCGTLAWTVGTWAQARLANSWPIARIATLGEALLLLGVGGVIVGVATSTAIVVYVAWGVGALGMGMTYPAIGVLATEMASGGRRGHDAGPVPARRRPRVRVRAGRRRHRRHHRRLPWPTPAGRPADRVQCDLRDRARGTVRLGPVAEHLQQPRVTVSAHDRSWGAGHPSQPVR